MCSGGVSLAQKPRSIHCFSASGAAKVHVFLVLGEGVPPQSLKQRQIAGEQWVNGTDGG